MSVPANVALTRHGGDEIDSLLDEITDLYELVYREPPYNGGPLHRRERFLDRTNAQKTAKGFEVVTAQADEKLVGFSFGFTFGAGRWWGGRSEPSPPADVLDPPKFAVIELVVAKSRRGQGLSTTLITTLLRGRPEPLATLLSTPDAPARQIYQHWGWHHATDVQPADDAPWMHALVLPLRSTARP